MSGTGAAARLQEHEWFPHPPGAGLWHLTLTTALPVRHALQRGAGQRGPALDRKHIHSSGEPQAPVGSCGGLFPTRRHLRLVLSSPRRTVVVACELSGGEPCCGRVLHPALSLYRVTWGDPLPFLRLWCPGSSPGGTGSASVWHLKRGVSCGKAWR